MQLSHAVLTSLFAAVAFSQTISDELAQLPSCSLTCLTNAATANNCGVTDYACQCGSAKNAITAAATPCILKACSSADALKVMPITNEICVLAASSSGSSSAAPESSSSSVASSVASSASSATGSISTGASTSKAASSAVSSAVSSASAALSSAASHTSAAASSASSAPATTSGNAASNNKVGALIAGAAAVVAFAL